MEYAANSIAGNNFNHGVLGTASGGIVGTQAPVPRTIASAIGRVEGLNDRLLKAREQIAGISDAIGGPRNIAENCKSPQSVPASNAVSRLNDSADRAHDFLTEIESLLAGIGRALGPWHIANWRERIGIALFYVIVFGVVLPTMVAGAFWILGEMGDGRI